MDRSVCVARVVIVRADGQRETMQVSDPGVPAIALVDFLARLRLGCSREGARMWLEDMTPALEAVLELAGLLQEMSGQPEGREEPFGLEEGVDPTDAVT